MSNVLVSAYSVISPLPKQVLCLLLILGVCSGWAGPSVAQEPAAGDEEQTYEEMPLAPQYVIPSLENLRKQSDEYKQKKELATKNKKNVQNETRRVKDALEAGQSVTIAEWFNGYVFPRLTMTDPAELAELGDKRASFFREYVTPVPPSAVRNEVLDQLTIPTMKRIVEENYHPAVRINAMMILGKLNIVEGNRREGRVPQPVPEIFGYLLRSAQKR